MPELRFSRSSTYPLRLRDQPDAALAIRVDFSVTDQIEFELRLRARSSTFTLLALRCPPEVASITVNLSDGDRPSAAPVCGSRARTAACRSPARHLFLHPRGFEAHTAFADSERRRLWPPVRPAAVARLDQRQRALSTILAAGAMEPERTAAHPHGADPARQPRLPTSRSLATFELRGLAARLRRQRAAASQFEKATGSATNSRSTSTATPTPGAISWCACISAAALSRSTARKATVSGTTTASGRGSILSRSGPT